MQTDNDIAQPAGPKPNAVCPLCGGPNDCAPARSGSFDTPCWCRENMIAPHAIARVPEAQRNEACVCKNCAALRLPAGQK